MNKRKAVQQGKQIEPSQAKTAAAHSQERATVSIPILSGEAGRLALGLPKFKPSQIALHEAGHLMAALLLDIPLQKTAATILPKDGLCGRVNLSPQLVRAGGVANRELVEKYAVMYLAGQAASELKAGRSLEDFTLTMSDGDRDFVWRLIEKVIIPAKLPDWEDTDRLAKAYYNVLQARSRSLVATHWKTVKVLAAELLARKTLTLAGARKIARTSLAAELASKSLRLSA
jgi:hypothetical protein